MMLVLLMMITVHDVMVPKLAPAAHEGGEALDEEDSDSDESTSSFSSAPPQARALIERKGTLPSSDRQIGSRGAAPT